MKVHGTYKTRPVWSCVKPAAKQDNLASALLKVHVNELHGLQQLGIKERSSNIVKGVFILSMSCSIARERKVLFLRARTCFKKMSSAVSPAHEFRPALVKMHGSNVKPHPSHIRTCLFTAEQGCVWIHVEWT